jgi:hypothetical protein
LVEKLTLSQNDFVFFIIQSEYGSLRITGCEVEPLSTGPDLKSFIITKAQDDFVFFTIQSEYGSLRITDCEVEPPSTGPDLKSFIITKAEAKNSRIYIRDTIVKNLNYIESSVIKINNGIILSFVNVNMKNLLCWW